MSSAVPCDMGITPATPRPQASSPTPDQGRGTGNSCVSVGNPHAADGIGSRVGRAVPRLGSGKTLKGSAASRPGQSC